MDQNLEKLIHMSRGEKMINMSTDLNPIKRDKKETVNHPSHYNREGALEAIDEMILLFGIEEVKIFCKLNAWKYRYRAADKNGEEDLKKSDWYINKYKKLVDLQNENNSTITKKPISALINFPRPEDT